MIYKRWAKTFPASDDGRGTELNVGEHVYSQSCAWKATPVPRVRLVVMICHPYLDGVRRQGRKAPGPGCGLCVARLNPLTPRPLAARPTGLLRTRAIGGTQLHPAYPTNIAISSKVE